MLNQRIDVRPITDLQHILGYEFRRPELLLQALTHKSGITERHPMAFNRDLSPLASVGDAVLKYATVRYLFLNGKDDVAENCGKLHEGAQRVIVNRFLAGIAQHQLHLEEYLIRGKNNVTPSEKMYADCMEAIFGAIALDCGNDQQEIIFRKIEQLCFQPIEELLVESLQFRLLSATVNDEDEDEDKLKDIIRWCLRQVELESALCDNRVILPLHERSCLQTLGRFCLWLFAIFGFIAFCCIAFIIILFIKFRLENNSKSRRTDL